jgi:hypothetical protein
MITSFFQGVIRCIEEKKSLFSNKLLSGSFQTFEDYKLNAGIYRGILESEMILREIYKSMFETKNFGEMEDKEKGYE